MHRLRKIFTIAGILVTALSCKPRQDDQSALSERASVGKSDYLSKTKVEELCTKFTSKTNTPSNIATEITELQKALQSVSQKKKSKNTYHRDGSLKEYGLYLQSMPIKTFVSCKYFFYYVNKSISIFGTKNIKDIEGFKRSFYILSRKVNASPTIVEAAKFAIISAADAIAYLRSNTSHSNYFILYEGSEEHHHSVRGMLTKLSIEPMIEELKEEYKRIQAGDDRQDTIEFVETKINNCHKMSGYPFNTYYMFGLDKEGKVYKSKSEKSPFKVHPNGRFDRLDGFFNKYKICPNR